MSETVQTVQVPLKQKLKTLLRTSVLATWYCSAAFLLILIAAIIIYDDEALSDFAVTAPSLILFFVSLWLTWLAGLILAGLPVWILAEKLKLPKKQWHCRLIGAALPGLFFIWMEYNLHFIQPWKFLVPVALLYIGNQIGKYIWKRHYKTATTPA